MVLCYKNQVWVIILMMQKYKEIWGFHGFKDSIAISYCLFLFKSGRNSCETLPRVPLLHFPFSLLFLLLLMKLFGKNTMGKKKTNGTVPHQSPHCVSLTQRPILGPQWFGHIDFELLSICVNKRPSSIALYFFRIKSLLESHTVIC